MKCGGAFRCVLRWRCGPDPLELPGSVPRATPSSALALGHPSDRKRLFQPQNRRLLGFTQLLLLPGALHGFNGLHQPGTRPL